MGANGLMIGLGIGQELAHCSRSRLPRALVPSEVDV
jgi:hypothetical protein